MSNADAEQSGENIMVLAVHTIEVSPDQHGWLNREQTEKALRTSNVAAAGQAAALMVHGTLKGCAPDAAMALASVLRQADSVTIYGHGCCIPHLVTYLRSAIARERAWAAGVHR
ncbi:hypothetical protein AB0F17_16185 [Nonomuraea sp. NPDC026600]|uniref:hypothetical protein n=1 Tax=Nonomuraea sp. NPDC026600 TaxID=3155363 RepID=UPI0033D9D792